MRACMRGGVPGVRLGQQSSGGAGWWRHVMRVRQSGRWADDQTSLFSAVYVCGRKNPY